jgi:basic membrane protein A
MLWLLIALVTAFLGLTAVACGGDDDEEDEAEPAQTEERRAVKVGLVTDTGGVDDRGFNEFSINGLERAEQELGVDGRVYISRAGDDYLPNLTAAAEDGNEFVIAVGFLIAPAAIEAAKAFPETEFAGVDHFYGGPDCAKSKTCTRPNALGMQYPSEEPGYLAGVLAAEMTKSNTVSTVGGIKIPPVDNWISGFQQGVADTKPSVKTLNAYSDDFVDQAKCKEIALDQIAKGSKVVFQVAGQCGLGAIDAAKEKSVQAIGVDADQAYLGPQVITSAVKKVDVAVFEAIKAAQDGSWKGGADVVATVKSGGVGIGKISVTGQKYADQVKQVQDQIASGELADIPDTVGGGT